MKKIVLTFFCFLFLASYAAEMLDVDYNFIDTAFDGIKPVTNKQFDDTIRRMTPEPAPTTFLDKLRVFLFGRRYGVQNSKTNVKKDTDFKAVDEKAAINELKNGIFYIKLIASVVTPDGTIIPLGNYKIKQQIVNNQNMLAFYQGNKMYGMLKLIKFDDTLKNENDISYSRVDILSDDTLRIVYSTISDTQCAIVKVYLQNGI